MRNRLTGVMAIVMLLIVGLIAPAGASDHQVTICHATASATTPYAEADPHTVAKSSIAAVVRSRNDARSPWVYELVVSGHGLHEYDIIPPFDVKKWGVTKTFPGLNWTTEGQAIWNNDCKVPEVENPPVLAVTVTADAEFCVGVENGIAVVVTNDSDVPVTVAAALNGPGIPLDYPVGGATLAAGATTTYYETSPNIGIYTLDWWAFDDEAWDVSNTIYGSLSFDVIDCSEPDEITVTLEKQWFDVDGRLLDEAPDVDWSLDLFVGADDEPTASLPGDHPTATMSLLEGEDGTPAAARYGVQESGASGYEVVPCGDVDYEFDGEPLNDTELVGTGPFGSFDSGVHLVCNQVRTTETITIPGGTTIVEREVIVEVPGETIIEEVIVEVEVPVAVLPEVIEAEPEAEPVVVAPEVVEVRGVTVTRAVPTGIDSGTGGYLPSSTPTAALLLLMLGGLALTGGVTASLVRRRG